MREQDTTRSVAQNILIPTFAPLAALARSQSLAYRASAYALTRLGSGDPQGVQFARPTATRLGRSYRARLSFIGKEDAHQRRYLQPKQCLTGPTLTAFFFAVVAKENDLRRGAICSTEYST